MDGLIKRLAHIQESSVLSLLFALTSVIILLIGGSLGLGEQWDTQQSARSVAESAVPSVAGESDNSESAQDKELVTESVDISTLEGPFLAQRVVDGDTIKVKIGSVVESIRLIGVDTPETVDPRKPVQCFGKEASDFTTQTLQGKEIFMEADASQGGQDRYGRLLRYVYYRDEMSGGMVNFNAQLIKEGYAYEYTYNLPYKYQELFQESQKFARGHALGLWGTACE